MLKNLIIIGLVSLVVFSCVNSDAPKKPANLISKDKMSEILYNLYIINAAKGVNRKLLESQGVAPEKYILTKYDIDSTQFADSNTYYAFNPETYKEIVERVKTRLEDEKKVLDKLQKIELQEAKRKRDSITKLSRKKKDSIKTAIKNRTRN